MDTKDDDDNVLHIPLSREAAMRQALELFRQYIETLKPRPPLRDMA